MVGSAASSRLTSELSTNLASTDREAGQAPVDGQVRGGAHGGVAEAPGIQEIEPLSRRVEGEEGNGGKSGEPGQRIDGRGENAAGIARREDHVARVGRRKDHVHDGGDDLQSFRLRLELGPWQPLVGADILQMIGWGTGHAFCLPGEIGAE